MNLTGKYLRVNSVIETIEKWLAVLFISVIVLIVFAATLSRYVFENPIYGADRIATYLMIWLGFIGFQIAVSKMRHIEIEFVKTRVKPATKYIMSILTSFAGTLFFIVLVVLSIQYISASRDLGDTDVVLEIPLWQILLILPVTFGLSAIRSLFNALLWLDVYSGKRDEKDIVQKKLI